MYARVTQFHILPEKLDAFLESVRAAVPHARQQRGYRGLFAFRAASGATIDIRVFSLWNSIEDLQAGEQNFYYYQALAKCLAFSKGFPLIEGHDVLLADYIAEPAAPSHPTERSLSADETQF